MSGDLVEKAARAMHSHPSTFDGVKYDNEEPEYRRLYEDKARAAILAVVKWGQENFYDDKPLHEFLDDLTEAVLGGASCHSPEHAMPETTPKGEQRD